MLFEADKVMFEIYRETEYTGRYKVVYFTELQDHNKETEINRALHDVLARKKPLTLDGVRRVIREELRARRS